jgi:serine/threonine-protein kinase
VSESTNPPVPAAPSASRFTSQHAIPTPVDVPEQLYGKYQLLRKLAVGGMAEVFLARQRGIAGFEKLLVVKRILPEFAKDPEFVTMFLDEARLSSSMTHPNVVQIYDLGQLDESYFLAMEYVPGPDLLSVMRAHGRRGQRLPFEISARVMASVADALSYAHEHKDSRGRVLKLVHRDVTPSNVLVSYSGVTKLVDFGIAKAESQSSKTAAGRVKGKTRYLAPEQLLQHPITARTDLWAAGICLYELFTGVRPINGDNELAVMKAILDLELPPPRQYAPDLPEALDAIVMRCLVRDPAQRMPSADELRRQLEAWLRTVDTPSSPTDVGRYLQSFFKDEYQALEHSLAELADRKSYDSEAVAQLPSMGLDVTPSGTTGVGKKKEADSTRTGVKPAAVEASSRRPLVFAGVGLLVAALAGVGFVATRTSTPATGTIQVTTQPPGAVLRLDGVETTGPSPTQVKGVPFGAHVIEASLEGYQPATANVTLSADSSAQGVALVLTRAEAPKATVTLTVKPAPERLLVDGQPVAVTGETTSLHLASGTAHTLRAEKAGHEPALGTVTAGAGETKAVELALKALDVAPTSTTEPGKTAPPRGKRQGTVELDATPPCEVLLGADSLGKTPLKGISVPAGEASFVFVNEALGLKQSVKLVVPVDGVVKKAVTFAKGKIVFDIQPWADVYLGAKKLGTTPFAPKELYEGNYTLKLVNAELGALHNVSATVKPGETTVVKFDMATGR